MKRDYKGYCSLLLCAYLSIGSCSSAGCAEADSFKTAEYYNSTGLNLINAANAYGLGYTGKGILLGVCDQYVKLDHPEFVTKQNSGTILAVPENYDWLQNYHGSHIAGIMAASKNEIGMHGVAFDADLLSGEVLGDVKLEDTYNGFNENKKVKIINNSWGSRLYIDEIRGGKGGLLSCYPPEVVQGFERMESSISNYDKVLVFAAGNWGHTTAYGEGIISYLKPQLKGNLLNVMSVGAQYYDINTQTAASNFVSFYSDLVKYAEENSLAAPGFFINSVYTGNGTYARCAGTSMAAPHVTATAGLVQQAFPYMNGKQIVDTVLSTANHTFILPKFTLTMQQDYADPSRSDEGMISFKKVNLFYFGNKPNVGEIKQDLSQYYYENKELLSESYGLDTVDKFITKHVDIYDNVPREMIFGQGLLDAGAAVRGPGLVNARRMDKSNFSPASTYGKNQALYLVDTKGYDSIWSNNIGEKRAGLLAADSGYEDLKKIYGYYQQGDQINGFSQGQDYINEYNAAVRENGLQDLPVGLLKQGLGTLVLTGNNTYQGSSIVSGGILQLDGSVADDAFSVGTGTLAGVGSIAGSLYNRSTLQAGSYGNPGTLTVKGNFESTGKIAVAVKNNVSSKISVSGLAKIDGTTFIPVTGSIYQPDTSYGVLTAQEITGNFIPTPFTGMLSASGSHDLATAQLYLRRGNNMENLSPNQMQTYHGMGSMYDHLAGQILQRKMDSLYSLNAVGAKQALTEIYGGAQVNLANSTQRNTMTGKAVFARLNQEQSIEKNEKSVTLSSSEGSSLAGSSFEGRTVIPLELTDDHSWWMKFTNNRGTIDAQQDMPRIDNQNFSFIVGRDQKVNDRWKTGMLFAYGTNDVTSPIAKSTSRDYRLGLYAGYNKEALDIQTYLDYGKQKNAATRYLTQLGMNADSNYDSNTVGFGVKARYNLQYAQEKVWQVSPYASLHVTRYNQDGYTERGAEIYSQQGENMNNTYGTAEIGIEMGRKIAKGKYAMSVGYKKAFTGNNPAMTIAYSGAPNEKFKSSGNEQDKEYFVVGINGETEIATNWKIDLQLDHEMGKHSKSVNAAVMVRYYW